LSYLASTVVTDERGVDSERSKAAGGKWRARYRDPAGREHARHFTRKIDAERWKAAQKASLHRGDWIDPVLGDITTEQWAETWLASKAGCKLTRRRDYDSLWRTHLQPRWGDVPLRRITYADLVSWLAELNATGLSPGRMNKCILVMKQLLQLAVDDRRLTTNVAGRIKPQRVQRGEQRFLTHRQLLGLALECGRYGAQYETFVLLLGLTGLRWGEARALRVNSVDLLHRRLTVSHNLPDGARESEVVSPKSHLRRVVPLPASLVDRLTSLLAGRKRH
jgi:integrase